ncbi:hypothetical protein OG870_16325 [Streptomyces sp. NBC_00461]|uniref:hypothetical protein n=1 Tax=Streptomyces sp. NBC_00461 TaxID=2975750 RepID=UPI002E199C38
MTGRTPNPKGFALALVFTGIVIATTASLAALVTGNHRLMGIAAAGFALQLAGWTRNGRRNGGQA